MVEKFKAFSQSEIMQVYKAIIGTLVLLFVGLIAWNVNRMFAQNEKMYDMIQDQAKIDVVLEYKISVNTQNISAIESCTKKNTKEIDRIKTELQ